MNFFSNKENLKNKKSLVIYFSHIGENYMTDGIRNIEKGNTEIVAEMIKQMVNAESFKVETIDDYPYNYKQCTEVALQEKNENARPKLKKYLDNIDDYEVIYIGFPNWWGTMPMAMFSLLEKLDFTGKIIKPFCTHEGSRMGNSEKDIEKICKGATVMKGLAIQGSFVKNSKEDVEDWIK